MNLTDAVVLITGASGGIGAAVARNLARHGAHLLLHGRDAAKLSALSAETGGQVVTVDLLEPGGPEELGALALAQSGEDRVDVVVHSAGIGWRGAVDDMPVEDIDRLLALNLSSPIRLTRVLLPAMLKRGTGHICFVASVAGLTAVADESVYSASKAGLLSFAESVRLETQGEGIEVSTVCPGPVRTGFFAARGQAYDRRFPRMLSPERVADCITDCVSGNRVSAVRPRWLAVAPVARAIAPGAYRRLAARFG